MLLKFNSNRNAYSEVEKYFIIDICLDMLVFGEKQQNNLQLVSW